MYFFRARSTPFFISYMEDPSAVRRGAVSWQLAMAQLASGDREGAARLAARALSDDPVNLYATLLV